MEAIEWTEPLDDEIIIAWRDAAKARTVAMIRGIADRIEASSDVVDRATLEMGITHYEREGDAHIIGVPNGERTLTVEYTDRSEMARMAMILGESGVTELVDYDPKA